MWRVKKAASSSSPVEFNSIACLQNSLKITAAGSQYTTKRPPLKRPKNKPGMPKDFVFVDLSPVKNDESDSDLDSEKLASVMSSPQDSPALSDDSLSTDESIFDANTTNLLNEIYMQDTSSNCFPNYGLGLMGWDDSAMFDQQQVYHSNFQTPRQMAEAQFETPENQITATPTIEKCHKRSKSMMEIPKKKPSFQFKTYKAPKSKDAKVKKNTKPVLRHRHTVSAPENLVNQVANKTPEQKQGLDDFMKLNEQLQVSLKDSILNGNASPITDMEFSEYEEDFLKRPLNLDSSLMNCGVDQFLNQKQDEFDFSAFIAL